jgi:hypothetical protein
MAGTTYRSEAVPTETVRRQIKAAQDALNRHAADLNGLCVSCRVISPCAHREPAVQIFYRYFRVSLPKRHPAGVTVPPTPVKWFTNER